VALTEYIARSLAPGIGLTSVMFYSAQLQNRMMYITGRIRDLDKEAREWQGKALEAGSDEATRRDERMASIRLQVTTMLKRAHMIRRTVLTVYLALTFFILTILGLLLLAVLEVRTVDVVPVSTFAAGFTAMGVAAAQSMAEMYLSLRTIREDVRTSLGPATAAAAK